jgi:hypothetical protein
MKKTEQEIKLFKEKHPLIPEFAIPKTKNKSKSPTNQLTRDIISHVQSMGGVAFRINSTGTYSEKLGKYIKSGATPCISDIIALLDGISLFIEVKYGKDKLSDCQIAFKRKVEDHGGTYWEVKTFDQFLSLWNEAFKPPFA